jgi:mRNA interferase RelE/StbE
MYTIHYHEDVVSVDIPKLGGRERKLIKNAIEKKLLEIPEVFGVPLRGSLAGYRKLRVGNYRIVFKIIGDRVNILLIEHRSVAYGKISKRI